MVRAIFARELRAVLKRRRILALAVLVSFAAIPCAGSEIVVRNDSAPPVLDTVLDLPAGSRIGAWLTSPVQGTIVGIQMFWGSPNGGTPPSQEAAIRISSLDWSSGWLAPGDTFATIQNPVFLDGQLNEFRYLDPGSNLLSLSIPVAAGGDFFIDLELANSADEDNSPGILMDTDRESDWRRHSGFVSNAPSFGWNPILSGVFKAGDLVIRAIIQPVPEPSSVILLGVGAIGVVMAARRRMGRRSRT